MRKPSIVISFSATRKFLNQNNFISVLPKPFRATFITGGIASTGKGLKNKQGSFQHQFKTQTALTLDQNVMRHSLFKQCSLSPQLSYQDDSTLLLHTLSLNAIETLKFR